MKQDEFRNTYLTSTYLIFIGKCGIKDIDCTTKKDGTSYKGTVSKTKKQVTCQKWNVQTPHSHSRLTTTDHNYCRNPDGESGLWCYTTDPKKRWDYCDVRMCGECDFGKSNIEYHRNNID